MNQLVAYTKKMFRVNRKQPGIYPTIDRLVDILNTPELNNLILETIENDDDRNNLLMFCNLFLYSKLASNQYITHYQIKHLLSELIRDPQKLHIIRESIGDLKTQIDTSVAKIVRGNTLEENNVRQVSMNVNSNEIKIHKVK